MEGIFKNKIAAYYDTTIFRNLVEPQVDVLTTTRGAVTFTKYLAITPWDEKVSLSGKTQKLFIHPFSQKCDSYLKNLNCDKIVQIAITLREKGWEFERIARLLRNFSVRHAFDRGIVYDENRNETLPLECDDSEFFIHDSTDELRGARALAYFQRGPVNGPLEGRYGVHLLTDQIDHGNIARLLGIVTHELIHKRVAEVYPDEEDQHGPKFLEVAERTSELLRALGGAFFPDLGLDGCYY